MKAVGSSSIPRWALFLAACGEALNEFYISNHTDQAFWVSMHPRLAEQIDLRSGDLISTIEGSAHASLIESLLFEFQGDKLNFTIPAPRTAFFGFSSGSQQPFETRMVEANGATGEIDGSNHRNHLSIRDRLAGTIIDTTNFR